MELHVISRRGKFFNKKYFMFTFTPINIATVAGYVSDEVHISGKFSLNPKAVLSFIPVDISGKRVSAPICEIRLEGEAFNEFYSNWDSESDLYSQLLNLYLSNVSGMTIIGVDISKAQELTATQSTEVTSSII